MLTELEWLRPLWFLALLPLAWLLLTHRRRRRHSRWQTLLPPHLATRLFTEQDTAAPTRWRLGLLGAAWLLAVIALAGPALPQPQQPGYILPQARILIMDLSLSMRATDLAPDRLSRARFKALDLLPHWQEGETALIGYAGDAYLISPLTTDVANLSNLIPHLDPEIMPQAGSNLLAALILADATLTRAGYHNGQLILFTDGIPDSQQAPVIRFAEEHPWQISVLSFGTQEGAPIPTADGDLLKDRQGRIVISRLDRAPLAQLAQHSGGRLVSLRPDSRDVKQLLADRPDRARAQQQQPTVRARQELGYWLILPLLVLALALFRLQGPSLWLVLLVLLPSPHPARAAGWWLTPDQQGARLYEQQRFNEAAAHFDNPQWQGAAWYRTGDYRKALEAFSRDNSASGWYNRGNALAAMQRYQEAINAYQRALQLDPELADARYNRELVEQVVRQQQGQGQTQPADGQRQQQGSAPPSGGQGQQQGNASPSDRQEPQPGETVPSTGQRPGQSHTDPADAPGPSPTEADGDAGQTGRQASDNPPATPRAQQPSPPTDPTGVAGEAEQGEQDARLQHWLRRLPDDPSRLLRNKLQRQHQRRSQPAQPMEEPW